MKQIRFLLTGSAAGFLNGLFGAGGGMVVVPMLQRDGLPPERSHATSIAVILPLSIASSLLYLSMGSIRLAQALPYIPLGLVGAAVGGWLLPRVKTVWLHRIFGALVLYSAARLLLLGMGAGAVLLLYLRVYGGCDQLTAQGINLLFFLPIALLSILLHARNHLIDWKAAGLCVLTGLPGVLLGVWCGRLLGTGLLSKAFALLLLVIGLRELSFGFSKKRKEENSHSRYNTPRTGSNSS